MRIPAFFTGATVVFWGIESGNIIIGISVALLLEASNFISITWELSETDFVRISDFTSVIFLSTLALILLNVETRFFLKELVKWSPLINLPLILAQLYSTNDKIIIGTRLGRKKKKAHVHKPMDFTFPYCAICILSAAIANSRSLLFFPVVLLLLGWLLLVNRGKSFSLPIFFLLISVTAGLGFAGLRGAEISHDYLTSRFHKFVRGYYWEKFSDPFATHLSFGSLRHLKNSSQIIIRLTTDGPTPILLKQASYSTFNKNTWHSKSSFIYLPVTNTGWQLLPKPSQTGNQATIEFSLPKEKGLLPFPKGSYWVEGETLFELGQTPSGIIKIIDAAFHITYKIQFKNELKKEDDLPSFRNLQIPPDEDYAISQITEKLKLETIPKDNLLTTVEDFFQKYFTYSLHITRSNSYPTHLGNFLLKNREGYCEMFATATALILRKNGIPTRYVTGFLVSEYSDFENKYIVRQRHAHAWVEAFLDGSWVTVDTTPATWPEIEQEEASFFEPMRDFFSYFKLKYDQFRLQTEQRYNLILSCIIILLTAFLGFRVYHRMQSKNKIEQEMRARKLFEEIATPFSDIENKLVATGISRGNGEPFMAWAARINDLQPIDLKDIGKLYTLHQKLRFDSKNTSNAVKIKLKAGVAIWLQHAELKDI